MVIQSFLDFFHPALPARKKPKDGDQYCCKQRVKTGRITGETLYHLRDEKHPDFQVTACHHFGIANVNFAYIESKNKYLFFSKI